MEGKAFHVHPKIDIMTENQKCLSNVFCQHSLFLSFHLVPLEVQ